MPRSGWRSGLKIQKPPKKDAMNLKEDLLVVHGVPTLITKLPWQKETSRSDPQTGMQAGISDFLAEFCPKILQDTTSSVEHSSRFVPPDKQWEKPWRPTQLSFFETGLQNVRSSPETSSVSGPSEGEKWNRVRWWVPGCLQLTKSLPMLRRR